MSAQALPATMQSNETRTSTGLQRVGQLVWPAAALIVSWLLFSKTRNYGLMGQDTFQIILNSRIESFADFVGTFTERLIGNYNFYRPALNLSMAVDYELWGLRPSGYQLTNILLFAGCALALGLVARRLAGKSASLAPTVAVLAFVLFPAHFEVIPVIARRGEMMVALFGLLAIWFQLSPRALSGFSLLPALFGLLAMGSKDNGLIIPPLCGVALLLCSDRRSWLERVRHTLRLMLPHGVVLLGFLVVRSQVVQGLGGGSGELRLAGLADAATRVLGNVLLPEPLFYPSPVTVWVVVAWIVAMLGASLLHAVGSRASRATGVAGGDSESRPGRAVAFGLAWLLLFTLAYALRGQIKPWYVFLLSVGWAILLGSAAEHALVVFETGRRAARASSVVALLLLVAMLAWTARYSPAIHDYHEWEERTATVDAFYAKLRQRIKKAELGALVEAPPYPPHVRRPMDRAFVYPVRNITNASVKAWALLTMPDLPVRLGPEALPDEIVVAPQGRRKP